MRGLIGLAAMVAAAGCSVVGIRSGTEEPRFAVVDTVGPVEIRRYEARVAIETVVDGDEEQARSAGFRRLADYIFGNNRSRAKIAMTAPVAQSGETIAMTAPVAQDRDAAGRWRIRFYAPASYTFAAMPAPNNAAVSIVEAPPETVAVLRFTGSLSPEAIARRRAELTAGLAGSRWHASGPVVNWFYDPPWTIPMLRRNEVAVPVATAQ